MKKIMFASCVDWKGCIPVIESGKEISKTTFLKHCGIDTKTKKSIKDYPHDFVFYKGTGKYKNIYYFTHSMIEYFFKNGDK